MASSSAQRTLDRRVKVVSDFERNLTSELIPIAGTTDEAAQRAIKFAIGSMTLISVEVRRDSTFIPTFISNFRDAWKGVWAWLEFLHTHCVLRHEYGETIMLQALRIIPFIITIFAFNPEGYLRSSISRTPGVFRVLVPHWLQEGVDSTQDLANIEAEFNFSSALSSLLQGEEGQDATVLANVVDAADGGADAIAKVAVNHLRIVITKSPPDIHAILFRLFLVSVFSTTVCPPLRSAMLLNESLSIIIDTMNVMTAQPAEFFTHSIFTPLATFTFRTLVIALESSNGPLWIAQALDAGLLPAVLQLGLRLAQSDIDSVRAKTPPQKVFNIVQQHFVYRSVLRRLPKALKKIDRGDIDGRLTGPIRDGWAKFKTSAGVSLDLKAEYETARTAWQIEPGCFGCQSPDVSYTSLLPEAQEHL